MPTNHTPHFAESIRPERASRHARPAVKAIARDVAGVEGNSEVATYPWRQFRVHQAPRGAVPVLGDPVVVVEARLEVVGEATTDASRHTVVSECTAREDCGPSNITLTGPLARVRSPRPVNVRVDMTSTAAGRLPDLCIALYPGTSPPAGPWKTTHTARSSVKSSNQCSTPAATKMKSPASN
jgi:hypothetical protein